jgi:hypothetical protein
MIEELNTHPNGCWRSKAITCSRCAKIQVMQNSLTPDSNSGAKLPGFIRRLFSLRRGNKSQKTPGEELEEPNVQTEKQYLSGFSIEYNGKSFLNRNGTAVLGINFSTNSTVRVDDLHISVNDNEFQALDWTPFSFSENVSRMYRFNLNDILKVGGEVQLKELKLTVGVNGQEYQSRLFSIANLIL